jgi:hypothetical protein
MRDSVFAAGREGFPRQIPSVRQVKENRRYRVPMFFSDRLSIYELPRTASPAVT